MTDIPRHLTTSSFSRSLGGPLGRGPLVPAFLSSFHELAAAERKRVKIRDVQVMMMQGREPHLHARQDHRRTPGLYGIAEAYGTPGRRREGAGAVAQAVAGRQGSARDRQALHADGRGHAQLERHAHRRLGAQPDARRQRHRDGAVGSGGQDPRRADVDAARRKVPRQGARLRSCRAAQHARQGVVSRTGRPRRKRTRAASPATSSVSRTAIPRPTRRAICPIAC